MAADRYRCVFCKSAQQPQVDHIRPWAAGGLNSLFNFAILCGPCNRVKSNYWRYRGGFEMYRGWEGSEDMITARRILACERRHRWNPLRWLRAAWALG